MSSAREGTFTSVAERLCGHSAMLLGWRPEEFWETTPAELACILTAMRSPETGAVAPLARGEMQRMMERDNG
ncbi:phage tail assembly chaperone [Croceicoccus hydrothermalis]|uniref:phage tail assembly chaperone n=1 Tax=Croceicoccus hydrothermalis TaxID=2867964 RepID=UPI001EFAB591|nr:phage tail assembly chaperone [Croceicoccus hydrothermalis]